MFYAINLYNLCNGDNIVVLKCCRVDLEAIISNLFLAGVSFKLRKIIFEFSDLS